MHVLIFKLFIFHGTDMEDDVITVYFGNVASLKDLTIVSAHFYSQDMVIITSVSMIFKAFFYSL